MKIRPKIYYVFSGRFPSEKAHALYVAKVTDAIASLGYDVAVVVPKRTSIKAEARSFFATAHAVEVIHLPALDAIASKLPIRVGFVIRYACFSVSVFFWFLYKSSRDCLVLSNESIPCLLLALAGKRVVYEMHDYPERYKAFYVFLCKKVEKVLTQNKWKEGQLIEFFGVPKAKIIVEPNGVEVKRFNTPLTREEARLQLGLPQDRKLVVYTGSLFDWKGADVLAEAARLLPQEEYRVIFVGSNEKDVARFKEQFGEVETVLVVGHRPYTEMHMWQKAADYLVIPNTGHQNISRYYTSPMKLLEYLASGVPVIASDLPSIRSMVDDEIVTFFDADDPQSLSETICRLKDNVGLNEKVEKGVRLSQQHSWEKRAVRILERLGFSSSS